MKKKKIDTNQIPSSPCVLGSNYLIDRLFVHYWYAARHIFDVQKCNAFQCFRYCLLQTGKSNHFALVDEQNISFLSVLAKFYALKLHIVSLFKFWIVFYQAHAMKELANKLFRTLKNDPENFEAACSMRGRRRNKAITGPLNSHSCNKTTGTITCSMKY